MITRGGERAVRLALTNRISTPVIFCEICVAFNVEVSGGGTNDQEKQGTVKHPLE